MTNVFEVWKNKKISLTEKNSSNQLFNNLFSKNHYFDEIFAIKVWDHSVTILQIIPNFKIFPWNLISNSLLQNLNLGMLNNRFQNIDESIKWRKDIIFLPEFENFQNRFSQRWENTCWIWQSSDDIKAPCVLRRPTDFKWSE